MGRAHQNDGDVGRGGTRLGIEPPSWTVGTSTRSCSRPARAARSPRFAHAIKQPFQPRAPARQAHSLGANGALYQKEMSFLRRMMRQTQLAVQPWFG
jgi:hypothetical protein